MGPAVSVRTGQLASARVDLLPVAPGPQLCHPQQDMGPVAVSCRWHIINPSFIKRDVQKFSPSRCHLLGAQGPLTVRSQRGSFLSGACSARAHALVHVCQGGTAMGPGGSLDHSLPQTQCKPASGSL